MKLECYNCGHISNADKFVSLQGPSEWKFAQLCCPQCFTQPPQLGMEGETAPFKRVNKITIKDGKLTVKHPSGYKFIAPLLDDYPRHGSTQ